jgi:hypothetical protein
VIEPATNTQQINATDTQPVTGTNTEKTVDKGRSAFVYKPPSNVRNSPNGDVLCSIDEPTNITIYDYAGSTYNGSREVGTLQMRVVQRVLLRTVNFDKTAFNTKANQNSQWT